MSFTHFILSTLLFLFSLFENYQYLLESMFEWKTKYFANNLLKAINICLMCVIYLYLSAHSFIMKIFISYFIRDKKKLFLDAFKMRPH
jgi:hypothetical protein